MVSASSHRCRCAAEYSKFCTRCLGVFVADRQGVCRRYRRAPLLCSTRSVSYAAVTSRRGEAVALPSSSSARPLLKAPLAVGDIAPDVALRALDGATIDLRGDTIAGNPIAVLFCPKFTGAVAEAIAGFRAGEAGFAAAGAREGPLTPRPGQGAGGQCRPLAAGCPRHAGTVGPPPAR